MKDCHVKSDNNFVKKNHKKMYKINVKLKLFLLLLFNLQLFKLTFSMCSIFEKKCLKNSNAIVKVRIFQVCISPDVFDDSRLAVL